MISLPITNFYAAVFTVLFIALTVFVIRERRRKNISLFDGGEKLLGARIRAHANFAEYAPFFLLLFTLNELQNALPSWLLYLIGGLFLLVAYLMCMDLP